MSTMREEIYDRLHPFLEQMVDITCNQIESIKEDGGREIPATLVKGNFDEENNILYIGFRDKSNSYGEDLGDIVIMRDIDTNEVTGVTIMNYHRLELENENREIR